MSNFSNLDIMIKRSILAPEGHKKLTKKQLRKLVLAQVGEIADLTCSLNSLASKVTDLKKTDNRFANTGYDFETVYYILKKEVFLPEIDYRTGKTNLWKTKKQLRKLVLTQTEEIIDLICKKMDTRFANMDSGQVFENLKKEDEDEGGDEDYCEYCGEKIEECLGFAGNGLRCQDPIQKGDDPVIARNGEIS